MPLALSIGLHACLLGGAGLVVAGVGLVEGAREDTGTVHLDLRRTPSIASSAEPICMAMPTRSDIPAEFALIAPPCTPLDQDAWSDDPVPEREVARALDPFASVDHPGTDAGRGSTRVQRRAKLEAGARGAGTDAALALGDAALSGGGSVENDGASGPSAMTSGAGGTASGPIASALPHRAARALETPHPAYPAKARRRNEQGTVVCRIHVSAEGLVAHVVVLESSGSAILDRAAVEALERWRYEPEFDGSAPIACVVRQVVRFALDG